MTDKQRAKFEKLMADNNLIMTTLLADLTEDAYQRTSAEMNEFGDNVPNLGQYFIGYSACLFDCIRYIDADKVDADKTEPAKLLSKVMFQFFTLCEMNNQARKHGIIRDQKTDGFDLEGLC